MIDQSGQGASPISFVYFFVDRIAATYMYERFGIRLEDRRGREVTPFVDQDGLRLVTKGGEIIRDRKAYIRPESLHLLTPQVGDLWVSSRGIGRILKPAPGKPLANQIVGDDWRIIQRDGAPFFWPSVEPRAFSEREEWKGVVGYEGIYEVSNFGDIRRVGKAKGAVPGTILKPWLRRDGYLIVMLRNDGNDRHIPIHEVVAATFLGPRPEGYHINHISGVKTENAATNLEYVTPLDNYVHAAATGNWHFKLTPDDVREIRRLFASGQKIAHIAKRFNISSCYCSKIVHRHHWPEIY